MQAAVAVGVFSKGRLLVCVDIHTSLPLCRSPAPARLTESIAGLWGQALPMTCKANASEWQDVTVVLTDVSGSRQVFSKETPPMAPAKCISQTRLKRNIQLAKEELLGHHPTMVFFWDYLYWLAVWNIFYFPSYMGYSFPLTFIFFKMVKTTNQQIQFLYFGGYHQSLLAIIYHGTSFRKNLNWGRPTTDARPMRAFARWITWSSARATRMKSFEVSRWSPRRWPSAQGYFFGDSGDGGFDGINTLW